MATPSEKLARSLEVLQELQKDGIAVIKGKLLSQTHRKRLLDNGFIRRILKGWYIPTRPDENQGDSTSWYASFWDFSKAYLNDKFAENWWLSPEESISIHAGNWAIPQQLLVKSPKANNNKTDLLFDMSIFDLRAELQNGATVEVQQGVRVLTLPFALTQCSPTMFKQSPIDMRTALAQIRDSSEVLAPLLDGGHSVVAGRLAGAFRNIGNEKIVDGILATMRSMGYDVREEDPFDQGTPEAFNYRERSPYVNRIKMLWHEMRAGILAHFPAAPGIPQNKKAFIEKIEEQFVTDAYHSLSIEGYKVSTELIESVRKGEWNPDTNQKDLDQKNAMAARGYWQAFQSVKQSIQDILDGDSPGLLVDRDHGAWYRELFGPSVVAGILEPHELAGYRNHQVYIKNSKHIPLNVDAMRDAMPVLFELLQNEPEASVRAVLGHFIFVYIHPYMDGNGRMARFLMNAMLASGGYSWTIIRVEDRDQYMQALEHASVGLDIEAFAKFVGGLVDSKINSANHL